MVSTQNIVALSLMFALALFVISRDIFRHPRSSNGKKFDKPDEGSAASRNDSVAHQIMRLRQEYRDEAAKRGNQDKRTHRWSVATTIGVYIYTVITAAIAGFGLLQLREARRATIASQVAAAASQNAAYEAKRQADALSRAYIFVAFTNVSTIADWTFEKGLIDVDVVLQNFGAAPAIVSHLSCAVLWGTDQNPPSDAIPRVDADRFSAWAEAKGEVIISAKEHRNFACQSPWPENGPGPEARDQFGELPKSKRGILFFDPLWVVGVVRYADPSGDRHILYFCAKSETGYDLSFGGNGNCNKRD